MRLALATSLALALAGCGASSSSDGDAPAKTHEPAHVTSTGGASTEHELATRKPLDGASFPDKVLALTWDDGPDAHTVALAEMLASEKIAATFFVVGEWIDGVSSEPGRGAHVFETGHEHMPVLAKLASLGHRVANHTRNHVLLNGASPDEVRAQLRDNQARLDPFVTSERFFFRAPGGAWNASASRALDADPSLARLVGPIGWDIDRKDWESSLYCRSERPSVECERVAGLDEGGRVRAAIVARRYLASIESRGHGVVLFHDRVGHVGSTYALDVARLVIPELKADGFVFAAPVLAFSSLRPRASSATSPELLRAAKSDDLATPFRLGDLDGDGRADACGHDALGVVCATARTLPRASDRTLETSFYAQRSAPALALPSRAFDLADVDGDGRADLCTETLDGIACALASSTGAFGSLRRWSAVARAGWDDAADFSEADGWDEPRDASLRYGDLDGDGRADVCGRSRSGLVCARSTGSGFERARLWLAELGDAHGWLDPAYGDTIRLADVNGDGRADLCARAREGVVCALSNGHAFGRLHKWSFGAELSDADPITRWRSPEHYATLRFGDLNGDGRADLCALGERGVVCGMAP